MLISDQSKILKCPHCGALRYMINVLSGNSMGAVRWSDTKVEAPKMLSSSSVLRCPACKRYHFYSDSELVGWSEPDWERTCWDCGTLSYQSLKKALAQLQPSGDKEKMLRMMLVNGYNDWYGGCPGTRQPSEAPAEERTYFEQNARRLIELVVDDSLEWMFVSAELHRELGEFEQAISLLDSIPKDWFLFSMAEQIRHHAEQHDCRVFILDNPESQYRRIPSKECEGEICQESEESIRVRTRIDRERVAFDEDDGPL